MAYDLVTWSDRVGASGDNKYNMLGATKLDGSVDTGNPTRIYAGTSTFSSPPTIAEINAAGGINQVIALFNRRVSQLNTLRNGSIVSAFSYQASDTRVTTAALSALFTAINNLRVGEGFATYASFPSLSANTVMKGSALAHARKALAISGVQTIELSTLGTSPASRWTRQVDGTPYGTVSATNISTLVSIATNYGGRGVYQAGPNEAYFSGGTGYVRTRIVCPLPIYGFVDSSQIVSASLQLVVNTAGVGSGIGEIGVSSSATMANTKSTPASADFDDSFAASTTFSTTGTKTVSIPAAEFNTPNIVRQALWVETHEKAGDASALVGASQVSPRDSSATGLSLIVDFG